jgi:hypothetical protein
MKSKTNDDIVKSIMREVMPEDYFAALSVKDTKRAMLMAQITLLKKVKRNINLQGHTLAAIYFKQSVIAIINAEITSLKSKLKENENGERN